MKKIGFVCAIFLCLGFLTGCDKGFNGLKKELENAKSEAGETEKKEEETLKTKTCTLSTDVSTYQVEATYNIMYKSDVVEKVETVEVVTSDDQDILDTFEDTLNQQYKTMKRTYGGYEFEVTNNGSKVESRVTIDYNKVDMDQLVKDSDELEDYVNSNNRLTVDGITKLYKSMGATCR